MKYLLLLIHLLGFPIVLNSQIHSSVDLVSGFDFVNTYYDNSSPLFIPRNNKLGYRFGMNYNFRIYNNIMIKTGIRYVKLGNIYSDIVVDESAQNFDPEITFSKEFLNENYIEFPLIVRLENDHSKINLYVEFGMSPHFVSGSEIIRETNLEKNITRLDHADNIGSRINLALIFGVGVNYQLSKHYQLFATPTFRYYQRGATIYKGIGATLDYILNLGLELGVRRVFSFSKPG